LAPTPERWSETLVGGGGGAPPAPPPPPPPRGGGPPPPPPPTAGLAILPATATRAEVLIARCEYIAATSATPAERDARLNRDWRCLRTEDKFTVSDWHARQPA
jgi:hypothetical protein